MPKRRWTDDDSGSVAGPNDETTMPKAGQGIGRRTCASRRDDCVSEAPGIGVSAPQSGRSRGFRKALDDGLELPVLRILVPRVLIFLHVDRS